MNKKIIVIPILIILISALVGLIYYIYIKTPNNEKEQYKITTDMRFSTMRNDGGSNTNEYYYVDLKNKNIIKYEDNYIGFKGYEYKGKEIYSKKLTEYEKYKLKKILKEELNSNIKGQYDIGWYEIKTDSKTITTKNIGLKLILTVIDKKE